jgi:hypothetical protein
MPSATREIDRDELFDIAVDVGALLDYISTLEDREGSPPWLRLEKIRARLLVALGLYWRHDDGSVWPFNENDLDARGDVELSRSREWLADDLAKLLVKVT